MYPLGKAQSQGTCVWQFICSLPGPVDLLLCPLLLPLREHGLSGCVDAVFLPPIHTGGVSASARH